MAWRNTGQKYDGASNGEEDVTMVAEDTPDLIRAELASVHADLAELPASAFEQRAVLRDRLSELRALVAELRAASPTDRDGLKVRLRRLEAELERRLAYRVSPSAGAQTGRGGGMDPEYVHILNRQIDQGQDVAELKAEIRRIRTLLSDD